jgi:hypothetical protein
MSKSSRLSGRHEKKSYGHERTSEALEKIFEGHETTLSTTRTPLRTS